MVTHSDAGGGGSAGAPGALALEPLVMRSAAAELDRLAFFVPDLAQTLLPGDLGTLHDAVEAVRELTAAMDRAAGANRRARSGLRHSADAVLDLTRDLVSVDGDARLGFSTGPLWSDLSTRDLLELPGPTP